MKKEAIVAPAAAARASASQNMRPGEFDAEAGGGADTEDDTVAGNEFVAEMGGASARFVANLASFEETVERLVSGIESGSATVKPFETRGIA